MTFKKGKREGSYLHLRAPERILGSTPSANFKLEKIRYLMRSLGTNWFQSRGSAQVKLTVISDEAVISRGFRTKLDVPT